MTPGGLHLMWKALTLQYLAGLCLAGGTWKALILH
jgi:hypothetical protein